MKVGYYSFSCSLSRNKNYLKTDSDADPKYIGNKSTVFCYMNPEFGIQPLKFEPCMSKRICF